MYLTREEEKMLQGEYGESIRRAMEVIVAVGEALGAERLVPISSVHVSGVSVYNIGREGVELIESFARDARIQLPPERATVNPMGFDLDGFIPRDEYWPLQEKLLGVLARLGFRVTLGCTPYEYGNRPGRGELIAWAESSAVIYANSVLGARSNREGGIIALLAGITGRIYYHGLLLDENRVPEAAVRLGYEPRDELEWGLVGAVIGERLDKIPLISGASPRDKRMLKNFLAAAAAWGQHALIYIPGITPEYEQARSLCSSCEKLDIDQTEVKLFTERISNIAVEDVDAVFIGCPHEDHATIEDIWEASEKCGRFRKPVLLSIPGVYKYSRDFIEALRRRNVVLLRGTCIVVSRLKSLGINSIATNSLKAAFYLPRRHGVRIALADMKRLLEVACGEPGVLW